MTARSRWLGLAESYLSWRYGSIDSPATPLGHRGEQAAARFLRRSGLRVVAEGASDRQGELDLVAVDPRGVRGGTIVFVEVKTTASAKPGHPADRVDAEKQRRLTRAALRYLKRHHLLECPARFDVVAVWWDDPQSPRPDRIEHLKNAFEATGDFQMFC